MTKLLDEAIREVYEAGFRDGRADALKEIRKTFGFFNGIMDGVLDQEIKELDKAEE